MHRVVFFGMDSAYSTVALTALCNSDLKPLLVVQGVEATGSPVHQILPVDPTWLDKLREKISLGRATPVAPSTNNSLVEKAKELGIDVVRTNDANRVRVRAILKGVEADAFVIAAFPHLLSKHALGLARLGGLNVHPGRLPDERGPAPLFWALKDGRTSIGFAIHMLDEGEDSGDVVASGEISFEPGIRGEEILRNCAISAAPHLVRTLRGLLRGDLVRMPQPKTGVGRCPRPKFRAGLIDVEKPATEVFTFVAGCADRYSLFVECGGDRFFVEDAASYDPEAKLDFDYVLTGDRLLLKCNPGTVELVLKDALFVSDYRED